LPLWLWRVAFAFEADTLEELQKKLTSLIPELLEANGVLTDSCLTEIPVNLVAHREQVISLRT